jgi:hypothetical protein
MERESARLSEKIVERRCGCIPGKCRVGQGPILPDIQV